MPASLSLSTYPDNIGPFVGRLRRGKGARYAVLELSHGFRFGLLTVDQAREFSAAVRGSMVRWFGWSRFDINGLADYVTCTADIRRGLVRVDFTERSNVAASGVFAANPEMMLALCEAIDRAASAIPPVRPL